MQVVFLFHFSEKHAKAIDYMRAEIDSCSRMTILAYNCVLYILLMLYDDLRWTLL